MSSNSVILEGFLECSSKKQTDLLRGLWRRRWVVLDSGSLTYYSARPPHAQQLGSVRLGDGGCSLWRTTRHPTRVDVRDGQDDSLSLKGATVDEISRWCDALQAILRKAKNQQHAASASASPSPSRPLAPPPLPSRASPIPSPSAFSRPKSTLFDPLSASLKMSDLFESLDGDSVFLPFAPLPDSTADRQPAGPTSSSSSSSSSSQGQDIAEEPSSGSQQQQATSGQVIEGGYLQMDDSSAPREEAFESQDAPANFTIVIVETERGEEGQRGEGDGVDAFRLMSRGEEDDFQASMTRVEASPSLSSSSSSSLASSSFIVPSSPSSPSSSFSSLPAEAFEFAADDTPAFDQSFSDHPNNSSNIDDDFGDFDSFSTFEAAPALIPTPSSAPAVDIGSSESLSGFFQRLFSLELPSSAATAPKTLEAQYKVITPLPPRLKPSWAACVHTQRNFDRIMADLFRSRSALRPEDYEAPAPETTFLADPAIVDYSLNPPMLNTLIFSLPDRGKQRPPNRRAVFL